MLSPLKFNSPVQTDFAKTLKQRVKAHFKDNNKSIHANTYMKVKTFILLSLWIGIYILLLSNTLSLPLFYFAWVILGLSVTLVTINIGHDAIHGSISSKKWVNDILEHTFNFNGASAYMWKKMHNNAHHTYTNVHGYDEDISPASIIRISPEAELKKIHKYQHIYSFVLYCFATLSWVFVKDYVKFFKNEVGNYTDQGHDKTQIFLLFLYKIFYYTMFIVLPFVIINMPWYHILAGFIISHLVSGLYLSMVFMLAHAVEETDFIVPQESGVIENDWFAHQLYTTANFCSGNGVAAFFSGGLNQQVEHHLFPNICSVHYPAISHIVRDTALEYQIPYHNIPTFSESLKSHVRFLKKRGHS